MAILSLNLLIAIMGHTFTKVKESEKAHLTLARAKVIDSCEASLTQSEIDELK